MPRRIEPSDRYGGMTEAELRARVVQLAHAAGWRVFSLPIAKQFHPVKDAVGYPDLTLARHGDVLWFELKAEDGDVTEAQAKWLAALPFAMVIKPYDLVNGVVARVLARGSGRGSLG